MRYVDSRFWRALTLAAAALACLAEAGVAQRRPRITDVQISPPDARIHVGAQAPFVATAYDAAGNPVPTATFEWSSSNPAVASIDANGIAVGVGVGLAIITVRTGKGAAAKSAQAPVQVAAAAGQPAAQPVPAPIVPPLVPMVEAQHAVAVPPAASPVAAPGPATPAGTAALARQPAGTGEPDALIVEPLRIMLVPGERRQLDYRFVRADGSPSARQPLVFSVTDGADKGVRVDSLGLVMAGRDAGRVVVHAAHPTNARLSRDVSVEVRADTVRFEPRTLVLPPGATDTLKLVVPAQGRTLDLDAGIFTFSSSDTTKVVVRPQAPVVVARRAGTATITAESPFSRAPVTILVAVQRPVAALTTDHPDSVITLVLGQAVPLHVSAVADDSSRIAEAPLSWTFPDSGVARYDTAAKVLRGVRAGEASLSVTALGEKGRQIGRRWTVRVTAGGVGLSRARVGLGVGEGTAVSALVLDDRRQPVRPAEGAAWTSSADSIVRVSAGRLSGVRVGRARITARAPWDSTASADVFVVPDLVVSAYRNRRWDLYGMMVDDPRSLVPLTRDALVETEAAWAPDLTRIAYVAQPREDAKTADIYLMDADGSGARRLTNDSAMVSSPSFVGPEGNQLVFESDRGGRPQIVLMNVDGTGRRVLAGGPSANRSPQVSPDGHKVVFISDRGGTESVYEMDIDGGGVRRLTNTRWADAQPAYGPQGRSVYYLRHEASGTVRLYRLYLESGSEAPLTPAGMAVQGFAVSASGDRIAFSLAVRGLGGATESRLGIVSAANPQFEPLPIGANERFGAVAFRPATPQPH